MRSVRHRGHQHPMQRIWAGALPRREQTACHCHPDRLFYTCKRGPRQSFPSSLNSKRTHCQRPPHGSPRRARGAGCRPGAGGGPPRRPGAGLAAGPEGQRGAELPGGEAGSAGRGQGAAVQGAVPACRCRPHPPPPPDATRRRRRWRCSCSAILSVAPPCAAGQALVGGAGPHCICQARGHGRGEEHEGARKPGLCPFATPAEGGAAHACVVPVQPPSSACRWPGRRPPALRFLLPARTHPDAAPRRAAPAVLARRPRAACARTWRTSRSTTAS